MEKKNWIEDMKCHVILSMPDRSALGLWISKSENSKEFINKFLDNWYKVIKEKPKLHGHIVLEEKCTNCGEVLNAKEYDDEIRCWCQSCHHQELGKRTIKHCC